MFASLHTAKVATRRVQRVGSGPRFWSLVRAALTTQRQRHELARLDDRSLMDLGLSRDQARQEANRPIWDQPSVARPSRRR